MKKIIIAFCAFVVSIGSNAQEFRSRGIEKLEDAQLEVFYNFLALDTLLNQSIETTMVLQIGENFEKYLDYAVYISDSIEWNIWKNEKRIATFDEKNQSMARYLELLWHDKQKNEFEQLNVFGAGFFCAYDSLAFQDWRIIEDKTQEICAHKCHKALATFRGRTWTVWYTPEIAHSSGPWKLHGLPGLILKAEDDRHIIMLEAVGIRKNDGYPIEHSAERQYKKHVKQQPLETYLSYEYMKARDPEAFYNTFLPQPITINGQPMQHSKMFYCPMELTE